jgi:sodium/potassium-transporting ATPase subunit alpha
MQWGNLLATRTRRLSLFQHPFIGGGVKSSNPWIIPAMLTSMGFCFFFSYVPFFQKTFLTSVRTSSSAGSSSLTCSQGVQVEYIFLPLAFGCGLLMLDEARKYWIRRYPRGLLAKAAW